MNLIYSTVKMSSWSQTIKIKKKKTPVIWRFTGKTDSPCCGDKGSRGRNKNSPIRVSHTPAVLMRFPSASGFLQTGQHNSEEIFHDIKEYHESCRTAGARSENKLSDLIQTVTYFFQKRSIAQVFTENGAACRGPCRLPGRDPRLSPSASLTMPTVRVHAVGVC